MITEERRDDRWYLFRLFLGDNAIQLYYWHHDELWYDVKNRQSNVDTLEQARLCVLSDLEKKIKELQADIITLRLGQ